MADATYKLTPVDHDPFADAPTGVDFASLATRRSPLDGRDVSNLPASYAGELTVPHRSPSDRVADAFMDTLMAAGAQPHVARHLTEGLGGILGLTPAAIPTAIADLVDAKARGDDRGVIQGMAGLVPGARGPARYIANEVGSAAPAAAREALPILAGDYRASTRFPTGVNRTQDPLTEHLSIGVDDMRNSPTYEHNVGLVSGYPGFARLKGMSPDEAAKAYVDQTSGNLKFLYENSPDVMRERSPLWYDGANRVAEALADRWGVPRRSVSGAIAALSPQMDWFKNASLAERVGDTLLGPTAGKLMTPEMEGFARASKALNTPDNAALFASIQGKQLDQLDDPLQKALWIRLYDEAHNPRNYRAITPEGNLGPFVLNDDGRPSKIGWGALGEIAKAVRALESGGDMNIISPALGTKHKVRNFYNNIELPDDPRFGDITADTHQVAAAQLRPLSGSTPAVAHNLSSGLDKKKQPEGYVADKSSSVDGVQGTYGLVADATRQAGADLGLLPRQAQSATWEPIRELFTPSFKNAKNMQAIDDIWRAYDENKLTLDKARKQILETAGGIGEPGWARPGLETSAPAQSSTYR